MSNALQDKIAKLFEATKDLKSKDKILPHCEAFNAWVEQQNYSEKSLGTLFSRHGLYSKFRGIPLEQGLNAELVPKLNADGSIKSQELKHYVPLLCGLNNSQWHDRNQSTRVIARLENSTEIDPDTYLEVTGKLLTSNDPHELAVGIIAATGRRPHEVLARAKFTPVEGKLYHVMFEGQGKKRGEEPVFEIATLYPAKFVIQCLTKLREEPGSQSLLKEVEAEFPNSITKQNVAIGSRRNGSLLRVVREYFGDKGQETPVLKFRHGDEQDNNKALRAAYAVLATARDCPGSLGAKILHASRLLGHFISKVQDDKQLSHIAVTAGYSDYFVTVTVIFPTIESLPVPLPISQPISQQVPPVPAPTPKKKMMQVRVAPEDFNVIKSLQEKWALPNQPSVVSRLVERQEQSVELGKQLQELSSKLGEAKARINQLEKEKIEMLQVETQPQQIMVTPAELEAMVGRMVQQAIAAHPIGKPVGDRIPGSEARIRPVATPKTPAVVVDVSGLSHTELWATKVKGASEEKIRRSYEAIALYNDTMATGDDDRLAITNGALRELSGVNGLLVGDWIKAHADEVISHNSKYGMQNAKDQSKTETYYNKRHGAEKIAKILSLANESFLDGEALKAR